MNWVPCVPSVAHRDTPPTVGSLTIRSIVLIGTTFLESKAKLPRAQGNCIPGLPVCQLRNGLSLASVPKTTKLASLSIEISGTATIGTGLAHIKAVVTSPISSQLKQGRLTTELPRPLRWNWNHLDWKSA